MSACKIKIDQAYCCNTHWHISCKKISLPKLYNACEYEACVANFFNCLNKCMNAQHVSAQYAIAHTSVVKLRKKLIDSSLSLKICRRTMCQCLSMRKTLYKHTSKHTYRRTPCFQFDYFCVACWTIDVCRSAYVRRRLRRSNSSHTRLAIIIIYLFACATSLCWLWTISAFRHSTVVLKSGAQSDHIFIHRCTFQCFDLSLDINTYLYMDTDILRANFRSALDMIRWNELRYVWSHRRSTNESMVR